MNRLSLYCSNCGNCIELETDRECYIQCDKCFSIWSYFYNQEEDRYDIKGDVE